MSATDRDCGYVMTRHWQVREREVDVHVAAGEVTVHDDVGELLDHIDDVASSAVDSPEA